MTDMTAYYHAYYLAHREHLIELAKKWGRKNRDRVNANKRYRYRKDSEYRRREIERVKARRKRESK